MPRVGSLGWGEEKVMFQLRCSWPRFDRLVLFESVIFSISCVLSIPQIIPTHLASTISFIIRALHKQLATFIWISVQSGSHLANTSNGF
jgi:hypothetical protein